MSASVDVPFTGTGRVWGCRRRIPRVIDHRTPKPRAMPMISSVNERQRIDGSDANARAPRRGGQGDTGDRDARVGQVMKADAVVEGDLGPFDLEVVW